MAFGANVTNRWKPATNPFNSGLKTLKKESVKQGPSSHGGTLAPEAVSGKPRHPASEVATRNTTRVAKAPKQASRKQRIPASSVTTGRMAVNDDADSMDLDDEDAHKRPCKRASRGTKKKALGARGDDTSENSGDDLSDSAIKPERAVSPGQSVPMFPNLPSGRDWLARHPEARGILGYPEEQLAPEPEIHQKGTVVVSEESQRTTEKQRDPGSGLAEKRAAAPQRLAVPSRRSVRIEAAATMDQQVSDPGPFPNTVKASQASSATTSAISDSGLMALRRDPPPSSDHTTSQPCMQPNISKPNTQSMMRPTDPARAAAAKAHMEANFNTTPIAPAPSVRQYEKPKAQLVFRRPDGSFEKAPEPKGPIRSLGIGPGGNLYVKGGKNDPGNFKEGGDGSRELGRKVNRKKIRDAAVGEDVIMGNAEADGEAGR